MIKLDLKKDLKYLYMPSAKKIEIVKVPAMNFAMIDGAIEPGLAPGTSPRFQENMAALYGIAYTLKFMLKLRKDDPVDYPVMALEGLWWVKDGDFYIDVKDNWLYTVMIMQPDLVTPEVFAEALAQLRKKKATSLVLPACAWNRSKRDCACKPCTLAHMLLSQLRSARMQSFAAENGYTMSGKHHEIYMGNPLRADPAKLKTVLRHPIV